MPACVFLRKATGTEKLFLFYVSFNMPNPIHYV